MNKIYGYEDGRKIFPPEGWEIIPEGEEIPDQHLAWLEGIGFDFGHYPWQKKNCRSTMTPIHAKVSGYYLCFARPVEGA